MTSQTQWPLLTLLQGTLALLAPPLLLGLCFALRSGEPGFHFSMGAFLGLLPGLGVLAIYTHRLLSSTYDHDDREVLQ